MKGKEREREKLHLMTEREREGKGEKERERERWINTLATFISRKLLKVRSQVSLPFDQQR